MAHHGSTPTVAGSLTPGPASDSQNVTHVTTLASPKDAAGTKLLPVPVAAEQVGERLKPPDCKSGPQGTLVQIQPCSPPSDLRRQLRASTLIHHLLDAELHYALSSNTIMLTFRTPAAAEWCVGALTARDLL